MTIKLLKGRSGKSKYLIEKCNIDKNSTLIFEYEKGDSLSKITEYAHYYPLKDFGELKIALNELLEVCNFEGVHYETIVLYLNMEESYLDNIMNLIREINLDTYITIQTDGYLELEELS